MKKLISVGFILFTICVCYAERSNRINLSIDIGLGSMTSEFAEEKGDRSLTKASFGAEYTKIFENGIFVGGGLQSGSRSIKWNYTIAEVSTEGNFFAIYPAIGYAYGNNQNSQIIIHPLKIDSTSINHAEIKLGSISIADAYTDKNCTMYKTGILYSKQWGKNLVRNGFLVGCDFIWNTTGDFKNTTGVEFLIGYKLSFGF